MHIVHCLPHSIVGGGQEVVRTLVAGFLERHGDVSFTVVLPPGGVFVDRFRALGVPVVEFPFDRLKVSGFFRSTRLLRRLKPDVIHTHGKGPGFYVRVLPRAILRSRRIHTFHGFHRPPKALSGWLYLTLERMLLRRTDNVIAVSESEAADVHRYLRHSRTGVAIIPNCADRRAVIERSRLPLDPLVERFLLTHRDSTVVTMIGRDDEVKNYPLAFRAMREICQRRSDVVFILVGVGPDHPEVVQLERAYAGRILAFASLENPYPVLTRSSILFMTSRKEGAPLVVLEAFCLGKPVVATNVPGISGLVRDGWNGLLCEEAPGPLAAALELLMTDVSLYRALAQNAASTGEQMDVASWVEKYYRVYTLTGD